MKEIKIKKMPDKKMLEAFIKGLYKNDDNGDIEVLFDSEKGEFIYTEQYVQNLIDENKKWISQS